MCKERWHSEQTLFIPTVQQPLVGLLIIEVLRLRSVRHTTLGRTPLPKWSARRRDLYLTTHNTQKRQTSMPLTEFEPTTPASKWPQTHALDHAATRIGGLQILPCQNHKWSHSAGGDTPVLACWHHFHHKIPCNLGWMQTWRQCNCTAHDIVPVDRVLSESHR
jgi:hypothetical protein